MNSDNAKKTRIRVLTLGCKVNQVDSAAIMADLRRRGFAECARGELADVVIVNSCTVTVGADRDVRKSISRARQENDGALIVLTGCLSADGHSAQDHVDLVAANRDKSALADLILAKLSSGGAPVSQPDAFFGAGAFDATGRSRAFLKVQDGCDRSCSYCIVPSVRGQGRSRSISGIVEDVNGLHARGFREVVLTGIHVGRFGVDLNPKDNLVGLLRVLIEDTDMPRIRLSSIEPLEIDDGLLDLMAKYDRLCHHLHVPLQSGDDGVLARMRRPYTREQYLERIRRIEEALPDVLVGADAIVGFPGESEEAFQATCDLVAESVVNYLHVFPYSIRPGTDAAGMDGHLPEQVKKRRGRVLRELGVAKWTAFKQRFIGRTQQVLAMRKAPDGCFDGLTRNYLPVRMDGEFIAGREYNVTIRALIGEGIKSRLAAD